MYMSIIYNYTFIKYPFQELLILQQDISLHFFVWFKVDFKQSDRFKSVRNVSINICFYQSRAVLVSKALIGLQFV